MNHTSILPAILLLVHATLLLAPSSLVRAASSAMPNIIFILADDVGYGDLSCYGATKIQTPNCDQLAREGLRFTDVHTPSAMCTPTRYGLLTGQYPWRRKVNIAPGTAGLLIEPGSTTLPSMLKEAGYATGVVGKWHLGLGAAPTNYNADLKPGPLEIGFDSAWLLPATGDRVPCVWVENHRVVNLDPADPIELDYGVRRGDPGSYLMGIPRIGKQTGGKAALWKDDEIADVIAEKGVRFIEMNKDVPFFLYLATHDIHVPRVPHPRFKGASQAGVRGDAVVSFDWTVGRILETLDRLDLSRNTLVIATSDNGGNLESNGPDTVNAGTVETNNGHAYNGPLRGGKYQRWEGGTRVPFLVRWPERIEPGESAALVSLTDMMRSFAALAGRELPEVAAPDSLNMLPALLGESSTGRDSLVTHGSDGLALRWGQWKFIPAPERKSRHAGGESVQLYNLATGLGETNNLAAEMPDKVAEMTRFLENVIAGGRSTPGSP